MRGDRTSGAVGVDWRTGVRVRRGHVSPRGKDDARRHEILSVHACVVTALRIAGSSRPQSLIGKLARIIKNTKKTTTELMGTVLVANAGRRINVLKPIVKDNGTLGVQNQNAT